MVNRERVLRVMRECELLALSRLGITPRRTAYNHPEGNSYTERFHCSLKEENWTAEYRGPNEAQDSNGPEI